MSIEDYRTCPCIHVTPQMETDRRFYVEALESGRYTQIIGRMNPLDPWTDETHACAAGIGVIVFHGARAQPRASLWESDVRHRLGLTERLENWIMVSNDDNRPLVGIAARLRQIWEIPRGD